MHRAHQKAVSGGLRISALSGVSALLSLLSIIWTAPSMATETRPLVEGLYSVVLGSYVDSSEIGSGVGGVVGFGFRRDFYAVEIAGITTGFSDGDYLGGAINGLLFPFRSLPQLYGILGVGALEVKKFPEGAGNYPVTTFSGGLGFFVPFHVGRYELAFRADGQFRHGKRELKPSFDRRDIDAPRSFNDLVIQVGLQLPFGSPRPLPEPSPQRPLEVIPVD